MEKSMSLHRAYSLLEVKEIGQDADHHIIRGVASTPTPDRMSDVVEPLGATFAGSVPLLWQHDASKPVGHTEFGKPTKNGIPFTARIPLIKEAGVLKDRVDEAIQSLKYKLVAAVSIGFRVLEDGIERLDSGGLRFTKTELMELSLVTIPANPEAVIESFKSMDPDRIRASLESKPIPEPAASGVVRRKTVSLRTVGAATTQPKTKGNEMNVADQIKDWEAKRAATVGAMESLMEKSIQTGETLDAEQEEQYQGLSVEVKTIDKHLSRLRDMENLLGVKAEPVAQKQVGPTIIVKNIKDKDEEFQGQNFTRRVIARVASHLSQGEFTASQFAERRWGKTNPQLVQVIKAGVSGGSSTVVDSTSWGSELAAADSRFTGDFIEYLYAQTAFDRLPLREIPANVKVKGQDGTATSYWVGESRAIPVSAQDFFDVELTYSKVAALAVISKELIFHSSPSAEMLVRDGLVNASAQRVDTTFFGTAGASGAAPAGILNGVTPIGTSGADGDGVRADIKALLAKFQEVYNASGLYWVMNPTLETGLSLMRNPLGVPEFAEMMNGNLWRFPAIVGDNVNASHLILMKPSDVYKIGDRGLEVSVSDQATIEMDNSPAGNAEAPTASSANPVSMFQTENVALKVVRPMNFAKRRASAVQYINNANYGAGS
jgi:HK97 family phage major capsid protein/HK97 family phage prohead protease